MKNFRFEHTPDKLPENCGIGWLLNDKIKDITLDGTTRNCLDFYSIKYRRIPQVSSYDFVELCNLGLDKGYTSILIMKQGIVMQDFIERTQPYWEDQYKDCVIVGHILDREEAWWQLHPQCMWIDLVWWEKAGKPFFGERLDDIEWTATKVERSTDTLSDWQTYNPTWIKATEETVTAKGQRTGWNLLNSALKDNRKVAVWDKNLRAGKEYVYGEMNDYYEKINYIGKELWAVRWYSANTEDLDTKVLDQKISAVYSTCGGLSPIANAYIQNLKPGGDLICYDNDVLALHMQTHVFKNWDGTNWEQFVKEYAMENHFLSMYFTSPKQLHKVDNYLKELGQPFVDWWRKEAQSFNVRFERLDLMNINRVQHFLEESVNKLQPDEKVFIDSSNAYNYELNATLYSQNVRLKCERDMLEFFKFNNGRIIYKGFDIMEIKENSKCPWLKKLFPWQEF
jgi:hypothetical protein